MADLALQIAALLPKAEGDPAAMIQLAHMLRKDGRAEESLALCRRAQALAPDDPKIATQAERFLSQDVPVWHFSIVRDDVRNAAYDAALRRAIKPGSRVLEIGTGTGLLAMMAARAGAAEVVTCEMTPTIAQLATEIVSRNGYGDRVRVISKHSDALDAETDLGGRADILVSEIVSNDLLGESVLPAHERAMRDLLKPGARVIPAAGRVRVALAHDKKDDVTRMGIVDGFDLSGFNRAAPPVRHLNVGSDRLTLRSDSADLFEFDFASSTFCAPAQQSVVCRSNGGSVNGVAQWIELLMDEEGRYENRPTHGASSCWAVLFHPLRAPIQTVPGQAITIFGSHDRNRISVWTDA